MITETVIPLITLQEIIDDSNQKIINDKIFVLDIDKRETDKIECSYPSRTNYLAMLIITKGSATIDVDSKCIELNELDFINIFPHNVIEFKHFSPCCQIKGVLISPDFLSELNLPINSKESFDILNNYTKVISLNQDFLPIAEHHLSRIKALNLQDNNHFFQTELLSNYLISFIYEIANFSKWQIKEHNILSHRKEDIAINFINLVSMHFREHKDVQFYAEKMHITRKHLTRTIKEVLHKVPKKIIEDKTIAEAKVLLLKNDLNINQVYLELNFADHAMFSKFFKKSTGLSPSNYRTEKQK